MKKEKKILQTDFNVIEKHAKNVDEKGNVLYLDEKMLERKEALFPRFKCHSNGIGFVNFVRKNIIYVNFKNKKIVHKLYHFVIKYSVWMKKGGLRGRTYKRLSKIYPDHKRPSSTLVMPLHVDITDKGEKVIVPMDMLKESLKGISFIGGMDHCLCREANKCKDYPQDFGCLFLGEPGRHIIKHNLGRELTYEEACARIDKAAELGLMCQAAWLEIEHWFWGIRNDQEDNFLEICFCCPCCCVGMRLMRNTTKMERHRFHPSGWTAVADRTKCVGCKKCTTEVNGCPVHAIGIGDDGKVVINQEDCLGCGICTTKCKFDVIKIKQTMPMRKDLHEYFDKEFNMDLKLWRKKDE